MKWYFNNYYVTDKVAFYVYLVSIIIMILLVFYLAYKEIKKHENK